MSTASALPPRVILASASPRRRELLQQIGIEPIVVPAYIDETSIRHEIPFELAVSLARAKATAVAQRLAELLGTGTPAMIGGRSVEGLPILAADTVVAVLGRILEKPIDRKDARSMLRLLSGRMHQVITGVAVLSDPESTQIISRHAETHVTFVELDEETIESYLDTGEWDGVAGAYRIQGHAARFIPHLSGSYSNVVGLPLHLVSSILTR